MVAKELQLGAPSSSRSLKTDALYQATDGAGCSGAWLDMIDAEHGLLIAMARLEAEERKAAREKAADIGGQ